MILEEEMEFFESEGKNLEEAIVKICKKLNVTEKDLDIEIISNSSPAWRFLGLGGSRNVKIRATLKRIKNNEGESGKVKIILNELLKYFNVEYEIQVLEETQNEIVLNITGKSRGNFIGKNGEVLDALQYIVNKIVSKSGNFNKKVIIDSEGYRSRKVERLTNLAIRSAEKVRRTRKPVILNPMNAHDRRIIHITLKNDQYLTTKSQGNGYLKKVVIIPKKSVEET